MSANPADLLPEGWQSWPPDRKQQLKRSLELATFQVRYRNRWAAFAWECVDWPEGERPAPYQLEVLEAIVEHKRESVRGPHGLGKTVIASLALLCFALTRDGRDDWKAPTTASVWRQLQRYLWPEVHKWAGRLRWDVIGRDPFRIPAEMQDMALDLKTGQAFAVASNDPTAIEGAHADQMLYVFDESKAIDPDTFDAAEGAFSTAGLDPTKELYALQISTPGEPSGRFYEVQSRKPGYEDWHVRQVRLEEAIEAGRISPTWAEQRKAQWGEGSAIYRNRVLGEFASSGETNVIPLAWVEAAVERWEALAVTEAATGRKFIPDEVLDRFTAEGVDVADEGGDLTAIAIRHGSVVVEIRTYAMGDTMETAGHALGVLRGRDPDKRGYAVVDVIGVGAGVNARLKEQGYRSIPFNASERSTATDRTGELEFLNRRAEAWWGMRERLDPANGEALALPPSDRLIGDLVAPTWKITSAGKIQVESKDDIRKRLGRSTDEGDALVQVFANVNLPVEIASAAGTSRIPGRTGRPR